MQVYPLSLFAFIYWLPESPRWLVHHDRVDDATEALQQILGDEDGKTKCDELVKASEQESDEEPGYKEMFTPSHTQFHPTVSLTLQVFRRYDD